MNKFRFLRLTIIKITGILKWFPFLGKTNNNISGGFSMELNTFLRNILSMQLTQNEITVLLELGYDDFTRDDLLLSSGRCAPDTYSPSALTKTLQKLSL